MQNNSEFDLSLSTQDLGLSLDVGPILGDLRRLSPEESERALADAIRQKALVNVDILSEILMEKAMDPTASAKVVGDTLEANYKMSGLAVKNAIKEPPMSVSITINGIKSVDSAPVVTLENPTQEALESTDGD
jgi:hypothetical protein